MTKLGIFNDEFLMRRVQQAADILATVYILCCKVIDSILVDLDIVIPMIIFVKQKVLAATFLRVNDKREMLRSYYIISRHFVLYSDRKKSLGPSAKF